MENTMETSKVTVKIYGQEYTIAGKKSREHIIKVADYVNSKMHEIAGAVNLPTSAIAVLSAVNAADEYFSLGQEIKDLKDENQRLAQDTHHYIQLWEEAKKNFIQYKEEVQISVQKREELQDVLGGRDKKILGLENYIASLEKRLEESAIEAEGAVSDRIKEMENNCFDLEMENIKLKSEVERLKRISL